MTLETTAVTRSRPADLIPGYKLEKLVGRGGMGEVHKAQQLSLGRTVAVKLLATELATDKAFVTRFEKEGVALASLSHPNIVAIVDKGKAVDTYFLVMEFVDGPSLREVMRSPLLDTQGALKIGVEICRAIEYAHSRGIIHRDLKPENILFDEQAGGIPKVSDFGLAGFTDAKSPAKFNVTETHVSMGTLSYMAPEQRVDAKTADHRADIYSLGVMLYELMVGEVPVGNYDPPSRRKPEVDRRLDAIIARCLKPIPQDRYQKVADLISDLEPMVPITFSQLPRKTSRIERYKLALRRTFRSVTRTFGMAIVAAALAVLAYSGIRARFTGAGPVPTSEALSGDLSPRDSLSPQGRITDSSEGRTVTIGSGPDVIPMVAFGRNATFEQDTLKFGRLQRSDPAGRAEIDLSNLTGVSTSVVTEVQVKAPEQGLFTRLARFITADQLAPRAALVLEGLPGRHATIVVPLGEEPIALEWALMERRGTMSGMVVPRKGVATLELTVDADGDLRAYAGAGKDRRAVGEPIRLGSDWQRTFGRMPRVALACVEASCEFRRISLEVRRDKGAYASKEPEPEVQPATTTRPAVVKKAVAKTPVRKQAPKRTTRRR
jgi:eukaryotic-like serine/threonine-protein kinase